MTYNSSVILQQKIKLLLLCRKYERDMLFPIFLDVGGGVSVLCKYLPSDTPLKPMLADKNGYGLVGFVDVFKSYGNSNTGDTLFLPWQEASLSRKFAYNYGYGKHFGYERGWFSTNIFDSSCDEFPNSDRSDEEKERAILLMLEYFCMEVFQNDNDQEEYINELLEMYDEIPEYVREDVRCNLEDAIWIGENIYRFYKGEWPWKKICRNAKDYIKEYMLFEYEDPRLRKELLSSISNIVPLFIELRRRSGEVSLENTFFSLTKIYNAGKLMDYFKKHPGDERNSRFLECLSYFNRFHSTGDCEFVPIWCRDTDKNLYVCFLSGSDLEETTDFNEMDPDFLVAMKEIQFLYEEIF